MTFLKGQGHAGEVDLVCIYKVYFKIVSFNTYNMTKRQTMQLFPHHPSVFTWVTLNKGQGQTFRLQSRLFVNV